MPTAPAQTIPINLVRRIQVHTTDNTTGAANTDPLVIGSFNASLVSVAVDPTNDRVVMITPVAAGFSNVVVNKTPTGSDPLTIPCTVSGTPANIGSVQFDNVITPDQPKP